MPAYFGQWVFANNHTHFKKEITDLKNLGTEFREAMLWRLGEELTHQRNPDMSLGEMDKARETYTSLAEAEIDQHPKALIDCMNDLGFMRYTFEDYQIVLSHSISPDRIIKVFPQGNEFGRILKRKKQAANIRYRSGEEE